MKILEIKSMVIGDTTLFRKNEIPSNFLACEGQEVETVEYLSLAKALKKDTKERTFKLPKVKNNKVYLLNSNNPMMLASLGKVWAIKYK